MRKKRTALHIFSFGLLIVAGVFAFGSHAFAYTENGLLVSENLLSGEGGARRIISFTYNASSIPANTTLRISFSQFGGDSSTKWYNSSKERHGWDTLSEGANTIDLAGLHWSGSEFYYRVYFTSDGVDTPLLDSVQVEFDSSVGRYDTYNSTGVLVSANVLPSVNVDNFDSFTATVAVLPTQTSLSLQFSQDNSTWYNSSGSENGSDAISAGNNSIDISGLGWSTASFYYRINFSSSGSSTAIVDDVGLVLDTSQGIVQYNGTGSTTGLTLGNSYNNLEFSGAGTWILDATLDIDGNITLSTGSLVTVGNTITLSGSWVRTNGTFTAGTGTVVFDGSDLQTVDATTFYNFTVDSTAASPGDSADVDAGAITVSNTLTVNDGQFQPATSASFNDVTINGNGIFKPDSEAEITVSGSFTNAGTFTHNGSTLTFTSGSSETITTVGSAMSGVTLNGAGSWALQDAGDIDGAFSLLQGTFAQGSNQLNISGNIRIANGTTFTKSSNGSRLILDGDLTLENEAGANLGNVQIGTSPDTTTLSGSLIADSLTIGAGDILITNGFNVIVGAGGITNSGTIIASGGGGGTSSISTASGFVNHGTYTSGDSVLTLSGSFINNGTFTANTGSVVLDGTNQMLLGSTTFYNLTKTVTSADTLTLTANDTFTVTNILTLQGAASNFLSLRSSTSGTQWELDPQGTKTIGYLDVKDSNNTNATVIDATDGTNTDSGNNTNWTFTAASPAPPSEEEAITTTTPSGGSRGGHNSRAMQARIVQAHSRILALYEGKREAQQLIVQEEEQAVPDVFASGEERRQYRATQKWRAAEIARHEVELELAAQRREERIAHRITEHKVEIAKLQQEKEELDRQYAERREERLEEVIALQEQRLAEQQKALLAEQEVLEREQEENHKQRELRIAQRKEAEAAFHAVAPNKVSPEVIAERRNRLFAIVGDIPVIFSDVSTDEWYAPYVSYVVNENIATGYVNEQGKPKGEFGISNPVTVAEVLKMALEAAKSDLKGVPPPRNASAQGTWASAYVAKAEELKLTVATPDRDVHTSATRGEVVSVILHVLNMPIHVQEDRVRGIFSDIPDNHPYRREILSAYVFGIIQGDTDVAGNQTGTFRPNDSINRAEVSKIIALVKEVFK